MTDDRGHIVGVISEADILSTMVMAREHGFKDIMRRLLGDSLPGVRKREKVSNAMSTPPFTVLPDRDLREAARILTEKQIKRLPVADSENRLIGFPPRQDIMRAAQER